MKDNSTGKDKEFYELGKKMFDRLNPPGTPPFKPYFSKREWVGLTGVEINHIFAANVGYPERMMKEVAKLLKEKNND
jgi:hypothetical protein